MVIINNDDKNGNNIKSGYNNTDNSKILILW